MLQGEDARTGGTAKTLGEGRAGALSAAALERLAAPASWYLLGPARELGARPVERALAGRELVLWRDEQGRPAALPARCAHQGARLAGGRVVAGALRCPFHGWAYGPDGRCVLAPGLPAPPGFAHLPALPLAERHGLLHLFLGPEPAFPLPFFPDRDPADLVADAPLRLEVETPWYMVSANGFDEQHFAHVHGRVHLAPPRLERPHPDALRAVHRFRITGRSPADRLARRAFGDEAVLDFTSWRGTVIVGSMGFGPFVNRLLVFVQPLGRARCAVDFVLHLPRRLPAPARALLRRLLRRFTASFFLHEARTLGAPRIDPQRLVSTDALLREYLEWLVATAPAP